MKLQEAKLCENSLIKKFEAKFDKAYSEINQLKIDEKSLISTEKMNLTIIERALKQEKEKIKKVIT